MKTNTDTECKFCFTRSLSNSNTRKLSLLLPEKIENTFLNTKEKKNYRFLKTQVETLNGHGKNMIKKRTGKAKSDLRGRKCPK